MSQKEQRRVVFYCYFCKYGVHLEPGMFELEWTKDGSWSTTGRDTIGCPWCESEFYVVRNIVYMPNGTPVGWIREHPDMYPDD